MFPLGTVLFPSVYLPLHVFEPRYRELTRQCLAGSREFGVVLIERGSEVGGDDVRTGVGTVARIVEAHEFEDGRWMLATVGSHRIRVLEWLPDDPYPRAQIEAWDDAAPGEDISDRYADAVALTRRVLALKAELGEPAVDATIEVSDEPRLGSYQLAAVAPLGPMDQQALLAAPGPDERLRALVTLLDDEEGYLRTRLSLG